MNELAHSLNCAKAQLPRVFSLHDRTGHTRAVFASPDSFHQAQVLTNWERHFSEGWTAIEWRDGEPAGAIADRSVKV